MYKIDTPLPAAGLLISRVFRLIYQKQADEKIRMNLNFGEKCNLSVPNGAYQGEGPFNIKERG